MTRGGLALTLVLFWAVGEVALQAGEDPVRIINPESGDWEWLPGRLGLGALPLFEEFEGAVTRGELSWDGQASWYK